MSGNPSGLSPAAREVVRRGGRGTPPAPAWSGLLRAAGLDEELASSLPQRLGMSFHVGAYDEAAVIGQLQQWADALRVRQLPEAAVRLDAAATYLADQGPADPDPGRAGGPATDLTPAPARPTPRTSGPAPAGPARPATPRPERQQREPDQQGPGRRNPAQPRVTGPRWWSRTRAKLGFLGLLIVISPGLPGLSTLIWTPDRESPDQTRTRAPAEPTRTWEPSGGGVPRPELGPPTLPVDPADLPVRRSQSIAETEVMGDREVEARLVALADEIVASFEGTARREGADLDPVTRTYRRYACNKQTADGVALYRSFVDLRTRPDDPRIAFDLVAGLPDPDATDAREALAQPRLDGSVERRDEHWMIGQEGRDLLSLTRLDTSWDPRRGDGGTLEVTITSPCHLLNRDRVVTSAETAAVPAPQRPRRVSSYGQITAAEAEQWWGWASVEVPRAVRAGAVAAGVELTLVEVGPREPAICATGVDASGNPVVGRTTTWSSRQPLTQAQVTTLWAALPDLAPDAAASLKAVPAGASLGVSRVQGLPGRGDHAALGHAGAQLTSPEGPDGHRRLLVTVTSPCGVG